MKGLRRGIIGMMLAGTSLVYTVDRPLFTVFPELYHGISWVALAQLPTPIERLHNLEKNCMSNAHLYIKDDGLTGGSKNSLCSFGGNKIRKLEFLVADALAQGAKLIMTYGAIGSNHVVATGAACKKFGLSCKGVLLPQEVTDVVKRNMKLMREFDISMHLMLSRDEMNVSARASIAQDNAYEIPVGGSNKIGAIGYVNAAFELKSQIEQRKLPEPDYIYVATGSGGTLAGLMLGLRAAGLKTQVQGIVVEPDNPDHPLAAKTLQLILETNHFLHQKMKQFPLYAWSIQDIHLSFDFGGDDYGVVTPQAEQAMYLFNTLENVVLDATYTGKAASAFFNHLHKGYLDDKVVLFWNTFCSQVAEPTVNYEQLAPEFHPFFKE